MDSASPIGRKTTVGRSDIGNLVTHHLAKQVFAGELKPGDQIPPETELVTQFGISRASVRSGLQTLATLGIIARQAGRGSVVQEYREWNFLDPTVTEWMGTFAAPNPDFLSEIFEFRITIEPVISAIAARRANARDLLAMEEAFEMMAQHQDRGHARDGTEISPFTEADIAFHTAIYRATHNLVWAQLAHILSPSILLVIRISNETADELRDSLGRHRHLMECIRMRDADAAFDAALHVMNRTGYDLGLTASRDNDEILARVRARLTPDASANEVRPEPSGAKAGS